MFALDPTGNDYINFTTTPSDAQTTTGFTWYGNLLFWASSTGVLSSSFFAKPTGTEFLWQIQWLANASTAGDSVPIAFKRDTPGKFAKVS